MAVTDFKVQFQHSAGQLNKNHAKSHQDSQCLSQNLNWVPREHYIPWQLYPWGKGIPVPMGQEAVWAPEAVGKAKSFHACSICHYTVHLLLAFSLDGSTASPVCPCSFWTTSFVCRFQMYTKLSSEPDTIHCIKQTNNQYKSDSVKHRNQ